MKQEGILASICLLLGLTVIGVSPNKAWAQYADNEESEKVVLVDKKIKDLLNDVTADNFDKSQRIFVDGESIEFIIKVENDLDKDVENVKVVDNLPAYLRLIFYPGTYNKTSNRIEWQIDKLEKGQSKTFNIRAIIRDVPNWISVTNPKLMTNWVTVTTEDASDSDSAKYYVASKGIPVTGAADILIQSGILMSLGLSGLSLRKFVRGY